MSGRSWRTDFPLLDQRVNGYPLAYLDSAATTQRRDELLLTVAEHASNLLPWRLVAEQTGATVRYVDVDDEGRVILEDLDRKLSDRTHADGRH